MAGENAVLASQAMLETYHDWKPPLIVVQRVGFVPLESSKSS